MTLEEKITLLEKKEYKKLCKLVLKSELYIAYFGELSETNILQLLDDLTSSIKNKYSNRDKIKMQLQALELCIKHFGLTVDVIYFINGLREQRLIEHAKYRKRPNLPRKDNKTHINFGYNKNGNSNKIRYPKKCRKNAWKRFYKLFPHLKPE